MDIKSICEKYDVNAVELSSIGKFDGLVVNSLDEFMRFVVDGFFYYFVQEADGYDNLQMAVKAAYDGMGMLWQSRFNTVLDMIHDTLSDSILEKQFKETIIIDSRAVCCYKCTESSYSDKELAIIAKEVERSVNAIRKEAEDNEEQKNKTINEIVEERVDDYKSATSEAKRNQIINEIRVKIKYRLGIDGRSDIRATADFVRMKMDGKISLKD